MKRLIASFILASALSFAQTAVISPVNPPVYQGQQQTFTCASGCGSSGTWSVSGVGSINSLTGGYTAPASVTAQQTYGGYQLLPNNSIFTTNISALPVLPDSALRLAPLSKNLTYSVSWPINLINNTSPTIPLTFAYSPANNGDYAIAPPPASRVELGWYGMMASLGGDHHWIGFNTDTGQIQEAYQYFSPGTDPYGLGSSCNTGGHTTCNSVSGGKYMQSTYNLPLTAQPIMTASGLYTLPLILRAQELNNACANGGSVNHALLLTMSTYRLAKNVWVWPAVTPPYACTGSTELTVTNVSSDGTTATLTVTNTYSVGDTINVGMAPSSPNSVLNGVKTLTGATPTTISFASSAVIASQADTGYVSNGNCTNLYGERLRLKASYTLPGATMCQQVLIDQLKNYGFVLTDAGTDMQTTAEFGQFSLAANTALQSLENILPVTDFEIVDESSLEITATSSEANVNRETVCYTPNVGSPGCTDVVLQGVAVNLPQDVVYIMSGTPAQQLTALVHDGLSDTVTWSMSPTVGTLTGGGLYTPPTIASGAPQSTTVTATSTVSPSISSSMVLWTFPSSGFFGAPTPIPVGNTSYTDANGNYWYANWGYGLTGAPGLMNTGNCQIGYCSHPAIAAAGPLYYSAWLDYQGYVGGDLNASFLMPAGKYVVTYRYGTDGYPLTDSHCTGSSLPCFSFNFLGQGALLNPSPIDPTASVGQYYPYTFTITLTVGSNNQLNFNIWSSPLSALKFQTGDISSLSVVPATGVVFTGVVSGVVQ